MHKCTKKLYITADWNIDSYKQYYLLEKPVLKLWEIDNGYSFHIPRFTTEGFPAESRAAL